MWQPCWKVLSKIVLKMSLRGWLYDKYIIMALLRWISSFLCHYSVIIFSLTLFAFFYDTFLSSISSFLSAYIFELKDANSVMIFPISFSFDITMKFKFLLNCSGLLSFFEYPFVSNLASTSSAMSLLKFSYLISYTNLSMSI